MLKRKLIIFLFIFGFFLLPQNNSLAQTNTSDLSVSDGDVAIKSLPEIPEANSQIEILLTSFTWDLDNSKIDWKLDGKVIISGIGMKKFLMSTGAIGKKQIVSAFITDMISKKTLTKTILIEPSSLDMLFEVTDGYVPPFYKGKILPISESSLEITAIPNRKNQTTSSQKNLIYTWKRNYNNAPNNSGFAKQTFAFRNDYLKDSENISVSVKDSTGAYSSSGNIDLVFYDPTILFYQKKDGVGVDFWNSLNNNTTIGSEEFSLIAEPYFITPKNKNDSSLKYTWKVNGINVITPEYKSYLTVRGDGGSGTSSIQLEISNLSRLFQDANKSININVLGN